MTKDQLRAAIERYAEAKVNFARSTDYCVSRACEEEEQRQYEAVRVKLDAAIDAVFASALWLGD
jgi:hypothetical protein